MAGCGIEYSWGKLKMGFRRLNRCDGKEKGNQAQLTEGKIRSLLDAGTPKIERVWKVDRKARTYRRQLAEDVENGIENDKSIHHRQRARTYHGEEGGHAQTATYGR